MAVALPDDVRWEPPAAVEWAPTPIAYRIAGEDLSGRPVPPTMPLNVQAVPSNGSLEDVRSSACRPG